MALRETAISSSGADAKSGSCSTFSFAVTGTWLEFWQRRRRNCYETCKKWR